MESSIGLTIWCLLACGLLERDATFSSATLMPIPWLRKDELKKAKTGLFDGRRLQPAGWLR
jgi:hypothetical protein